jgi:hypothetical protein
MRSKIDLSIQNPRAMQNILNVHGGMYGSIQSKRGGWKRETERGREREWQRERDRAETARERHRGARHVVRSLSKTPQCLICTQYTGRGFTHIL